MNDSIKLANLWAGLNELKVKLDNELIPICEYLTVEDPDLRMAMEGLSDKIQDYFNHYKLDTVDKSLD